ncbi:MAG: hypothetical protein NVSMB65_03270 [Chloroflexota bacterium]
MSRFDEAKKLFEDAKTFAQSEQGRHLIHEAQSMFHHSDAGAPEYVHHEDGHHSHKHEHGTHGYHHHRHHHAGGEREHVHARDHSLHADNPEHSSHHRS